MAVSKPPVFQYGQFTSAYELKKPCYLFPWFAIDGEENEKEKMLLPSKAGVITYFEKFKELAASYHLDTTQDPAIWAPKLGQIILENAGQRLVDNNTDVADHTFINEDQMALLQSFDSVHGPGSIEKYLPSTDPNAKKMWAPNSFAALIRALRTFLNSFPSDEAAISQLGEQQYYKLIALKIMMDPINARNRNEAGKSHPPLKLDNLNIADILRGIEATRVLSADHKLCTGLNKYAENYGKAYLYTIMQGANEKIGGNGGSLRKNVPLYAMLDTDHEIGSDKRKVNPLEALKDAYAAKNEGERKKLMFDANAAMDKCGFKTIDSQTAKSTVTAICAELMSAKPSVDKFYAEAPKDEKGEPQDKALKLMANDVSGWVLRGYCLVMYLTEIEKDPATKAAMQQEFDDFNKKFPFPKKVFDLSCKEDGFDAKKQEQNYVDIMKGALEIFTLDKTYERLQERKQVSQNVAQPPQPQPQQPQGGAYSAAQLAGKEFKKLSPPGEQPAAPHAPKPEDQQQHVSAPNPHGGGN